MSPNLTQTNKSRVCYNTPTVMFVVLQAMSEIKHKRIRTADVQNKD